MTASVNLPLSSLFSKAAQVTRVAFPLNEVGPAGHEGPWAVRQSQVACLYCTPQERDPTLPDTPPG